MTCAMSGVVLGEGAPPVPSCSSTTARSSVLTVLLITAGRGKSHRGELVRGVLRGFCIPKHTHVFVLRGCPRCYEYEVQKFRVWRWRVIMFQVTS